MGGHFAILPSPFCAIITASICAIKLNAFKFLILQIFFGLMGHRPCFKYFFSRFFSKTKAFFQDEADNICYLGEEGSEFTYPRSLKASNAYALQAHAQKKRKRNLVILFICPMTIFRSKKLHLAYG